MADNLELKEPEIHSEVSNTTVRLWKTGYFQNDDLTLKEKRYLRLMREEPQPLSAFELIDSGYQKRRSVIMKLIDKGLVNKIGQSKNTRYELNQNQSYGVYSVAKTLSQQHDDLLK